MTTVISLVGQQPIPNLLPIRYLNPNRVVLVHSDFTERSAKKLEALIRQKDANVQLIQVDAYQIKDIRQVLVNKIRQDALDIKEIVFNLTGGTKPMSLAAYLVATELLAPVVYLQSEGKRSRMYRYEFESGEPVLKKDEVLPELITADEYLRAYVSDYHLTGFAKEEGGGLFEQAIHAVLEPVVDEILSGAKLLGALDVDFVVRCKNQVGIIEAKTGSGLKKGLDQLNTAGGQQYLGTYTQKFLVSDQLWDHSRSNLKELADARRITVIELPSYGQSGEISPNDEEKLCGTICKELGVSPC